MTPLRIAGAHELKSLDVQGKVHLADRIDQVVESIEAKSLN